MRSYAPVSFVGCTRCSSWRSQQSAVESRMAQHVLYRSESIMSSLAAGAEQEAVVEAVILLQVMSDEGGGACRPEQRSNRLVQRVAKVQRPGARTPAAKEGNVECGGGRSKCHGGGEAGIGGPQSERSVFTLLCCFPLPGRAAAPTKITCLPSHQPQPWKPQQCGHVMTAIIWPSCCSRHSLLETHCNRATVLVARPILASVCSTEANLLHGSIHHV